MDGDFFRGLSADDDCLIVVDVDCFEGWTVIFDFLREWAVVVAFKGE